MSWCTVTSESMPVALSERTGPCFLSTGGLSGESISTGWARWLLSPGALLGCEAQCPLSGTEKPFRSDTQWDNVGGRNVPLNTWLKHPIIPGNGVGKITSPWRQKKGFQITAKESNLIANPKSQNALICPAVFCIFTYLYLSANFAIRF